MLLHRVFIYNYLCIIRKVIILLNQKLRFTLSPTMCENQNGDLYKLGSPFQFSGSNHIVCKHIWLLRAQTCQVHTGHPWQELTDNQYVSYALLSMAGGMHLTFLCSKQLNYTHPDSFDWLGRTQNTHYHCGYCKLWEYLLGGIKVFWRFCDRS